MIGLDLVDEFHFFVYPVVSPGASWFARLPDKLDLQLLGVKTYQSGVVGLHYLPRKLADKEKPASFSEPADVGQSVAGLLVGAIASG